MALNVKTAPSKAQNPNEPQQDPNHPNRPTPGPGNPPDPTKPNDPSKPEGEQAAKSTKSIVPSKYTARYKNGGEDPLAQFIKTECTSQEGFSFDRFFELCAKNGIAQDKVDHYKGQVKDKRHGAEGRARMTLRNMLATLVRKNGKAVSLSGTETPIALPKAALTGAAKAAQDRSSADGEKATAV